MIFLDEIKPMVLYKKPFHLPINEKDKKRGSVSFLLTPSYESSIELLKNPLLVNRKYYESYFIEKDITYFINQEGYLEDISDESYRNVINEEHKIFISNKIDAINESYKIENNNILLKRLCAIELLARMNTEFGSNILNRLYNSLDESIIDKYKDKIDESLNESSALLFLEEYKSNLLGSSYKEFYNYNMNKHSYMNALIEELLEDLKGNEIFESLDSIYNERVRNTRQSYKLTQEMFKYLKIRNNVNFKILLNIFNNRNSKGIPTNRNNAMLLIADNPGNFDFLVQHESLHFYINNIKFSDRFINSFYDDKLCSKFEFVNYIIPESIILALNIKSIEKTTGNSDKFRHGLIDILTPYIDYFYKSLDEYENQNLPFDKFIKIYTDYSLTESINLESLLKDEDSNLFFSSEDDKGPEVCEFEYNWDGHPVDEASNEVLSDPKRLARSLKMKMNKAKYQLNKMSDHSRNNVGVEKDSNLNSDGHTPGASPNAEAQATVSESAAYKINGLTTYYGRKQYSITATRDIEKGEVIDVIGSDLDGMLGPGRDGWNVELINGQYIATENIRKGSNLYCHGTITESAYIDIAHSDSIIESNYDECEIEEKNIIFALNESEGKSEIDKNHKSKGYLDLNSFNRTKINDTLAKKYDIYCDAPTLKDFKGYIYTNKKDNSLVAIIAVATYKNKESWIQPIEVSEKYRGYNLSKQLMDVAINELGAKYLAVYDDNEVAIKIYKEYGFKVYKRVKYNGGVVYFMTIDPKRKINKKYLKEDYIGPDYREYTIEEGYIRCKVDGQNIILAFNENLDENILNESSFTNTALHRLLYKERFKNNKEVFQIYDQVKKDLPFIKRTFINYERYKQFNLFLDLSFYNQTFFKNNIYKLDKGVELYFEFMNRFINDRRLDKAGYTKKTVFVPVKDWAKPEVSMYKFNQDINPISTIIRLLRTNATKLLEWKGIEFVFLSDKGYFKVDLSDIESTEITKFINFIERLRKDAPIEDEIQTGESRKAIVANIIDKLEDSQKIKINNLTGEGEEGDKQVLIDKINQAASTSGDTDEAIDTLEKDDYIKNIIASLAAEEDDSVKINAARSARINKLNDEFLNKKLNGTTVRDMLDTSDNDKELPVSAIKVDTVNEEWGNMQYMNFEQNYNIDEDIIAALHSLSSKTVPVMVRDISIDDTSNSEDMIYTYTVNMEDVTGNRFTIKFDIPKLKDYKFTRLRGNDKTFNGQLTQIPVSKTDEDTVQVVSNYKKIFISRFGTTTGKSFVVTDRVLKTLRKMESKQVKKTLGNNIRICSKYELPIDYIDIATEYSKLECGNYVFMFNQDDIYTKFGDKIDKKQGIPVGYIEPNKDILYYNIDKYSTFSMLVYSILGDNSNEFKEIFDTTNTSTRYTYSKASILNNHIPLVVILGYNEGLTKTLKKANIEYELLEKRPKYDKNNQDIIKFNDGYLLYRLNYSSSLLLNGLKQCNTEDFSLGEINSKSMWLEFLDLFGGKILADGLDNFYDMMIDPITEEVLEYYKLPTDYCEILIYANNLLADNKYYKHTDMSARRYRSNEIIAGYAYQALADSYGEYRTNLKRNKKASMTMKQSTVIDRLLLDPTTSDFSILNPLLELEAINSVTYKGLVGMNADRAYSLDKRTFDDTMINVLGLSTGFAGNVGITRQATMDMNITGKRGYIKVTEDPNKMNITKTFTATEALTPFGSRRDDPFRTAMTFVQTAKHGMRVKNACPSLISNGADQALPYMITNTFAYKAKEDGKIIEKTDSHLIVEYKDGSHDFVDLRETVQKNSDGGFYVTLKLDSDLKVGNKIKKDQILAYDKSSFSDKIGHTDDIAYNIGTLAKIAILNTDEGFEDSAIISDWLSDAMASDVVVKKDVTLPKNTNIYNMVKKGQPIQEGEPLMIFQNAFDEDDVNLLLKNLADDEEMISELGRIPIKSKITGVVEDIKIARTVEKDELSDSLKKKVNELEKPISDMKKIMKKYDIEYHDRFEADYALSQTGKLKNVEDGVLIEFYLKYEDKLSVGDKIIYYSALKGVVKDIFPKNKEPYTDFRPDEKVHSLLSLGSVNGRMVTSVMINGAISKVLIELDRKVKEMAGMPFKYLDEE